MRADIGFYAHAVVAVCRKLKVRFSITVRRVKPTPGSQLVTANGEASDKIRGVERIGTEAGRSAFANYLFMPPGESTMGYLWTVPSAAIETDDGWVYEMLIQKQPGARTVPLSVRLDLPPGAVVSTASEGAVIDGERVRLEADLRGDVELRGVYDLPRWSSPR